MASLLLKQVVNVNGIPSLISKIRAENFNLRQCKKAVVVIPGNPGIIGFYDAFLEKLYSENGRRFPVFGIQHAGHGTLDNVTIPRSPFNLAEQVSHKIAFLENYFPASCEFILIGHSIGAYIVLKLFEHFGKDEKRISKGILLFPTIERMALSPRGKLAKCVSNNLSWLLVAAAWTLSWLPESLKKCLVSIWFLRRNVHESCKDAAIQLVDAGSIRNILFMVADEMLVVDKTPIELISAHIDRLVFYYGASDHWTPRAYFNEMVQTFPNAQIYLCQKNIKHAFVLESHEEMARMTADWIDKQ